MIKFTLILKKCVFLSVCLCFMTLSSFDLPEEQLLYIQNVLTKYYDSESQSKEIKRYEINVTNTGFCRYRKIYSNGKEEYFAFNLSRFKSLDFYGSTTRGNLYIRTKNDDVIVQTRNDRRGEVDSTATYLVIPIKNMEVEQLNMLAENLGKMTKTLLANK